MEEFALTYLAKKDILLKIDGSPYKEMLDIYVPASSRHCTLRIRQIGDEYEITKKQPIVKDDISHQLESTIPITEEEFADLNLVPGKRIQKDRYMYKEDGRTYEVDVFRGDLKGLVLVDVVFRSHKEKTSFVAPEWVLVDVTQVDFIAGGMLCGKKYEEISEKLEKLGYTKI